MDSNLPKLTPTVANQILIHPDHAAGTLKVSKFNSNKTNQNLTNLFAGLAIFALVGVAILSFFFIPRSQAVVFANNTVETVGELNSKTDEVDKSLNNQ